MKKHNLSWLWGSMLMLFLFALPLVLLRPAAPGDVTDPWKTVPVHRDHLDHRAFFSEPLTDPRDATRACLSCHETAARDLMATGHWKWEGEEVDVPGRSGKIRVGKKHLINNFCIGIRGNWTTCVSCHAGYGWDSDTYDFTREENVDCLICHDWTGTYVKGEGGLPPADVDLLQVARSVGYPKRENCGICHIYGGGGEGVKHGDLDQTLVNPAAEVDVHMGRADMLCIDCHRTDRHRIAGTSFSVSITHDNPLFCTDCHPDVPHRDRRINTHLASVACETCHISTYAKRAPTKTEWDWSRAGNPDRPDDVHTYLKIKGEFVYEENVVPEYRWFNFTVQRYLLGDPIDPETPTDLNRPLGDLNDPAAKIWPFKIHRATQPYDRVHRTLLQPVTSGDGGYWHDFDWAKALRLGAETTGLPFSGEYGFARTRMYWPLSHMVSPKEQALQCCDCHSTGRRGRNRMDWAALGYPQDPIHTGGRLTNRQLQSEESR